MLKTGHGECVPFDVRANTMFEATERTRALTQLFDEALAADEFEYCCALLRVQGMEPISWDPLRESDEVMQQVAALVAQPLDSSLKLRLVLFLYCHVTEMDDLYSVPMNLLRIIEGGRYSLSPFHLGAKREPVYPAEKTVELATLGRRLGHEGLSEFYEWMLVREVRNAFFHSDYAISGEDFVIYRGRGVAIDGTRTAVVPFSWLLPRLEGGINLALALVRELVTRREAYRVSKVIPAVRATDGGISEATLLVDDRGLAGFRA